MLIQTIVHTKLGKIEAEGGRERNRINSAPGRNPKLGQPEKKMVELTLWGGLKKDSKYSLCNRVSILSKEYHVGRQVFRSLYLVVPILHRQALCQMESCV
jgi:hypothetical protein